jgi:predicted GNAT superfamily acetyltransferase
MTTDRKINELALKVFEKRRDRALEYSLAQCEKYLREADQENSRLWFRIGESLAKLEERRERAMRLTESLAAALSTAISQGTPADHNRVQQQ